jgi:hypothetical protein
VTCIKIINNKKKIKMVFLLFLLFSFACGVPTKSYVRCKHMLHNFLTDEPPFDGKSIACQFDMHYNTTELKETAKLLNGKLYSCVKNERQCNICSWVTIPRVPICRGARYLPDFCKNIEEDAETCNRKCDCKYPTIYVTL